MTNPTDPDHGAAVHLANEGDTAGEELTAQTDAVEERNRQEPLQADTAASQSGLSRVSRRLLEWVVVIVAAALIALGLRTFAVQTFYVPSGSMLPTLQIGDRILVDKLPFSKSNINRGDIVVFQRVPADTDPSRPADLVKRVIGVPGDTVTSRGDTVYINGKPLREPWLPNPLPAALSCAQSAFNISPTYLKSDQYFVMGDCRGNSSDSRVWGTVPSSYIVGKVFVVIWRHNHPWLHWF